MALWQHYLRPTSLDEAIANLQAASTSVRLIAGGTDLLLDMQQGREEKVDTLVDICAIDELGGVYQSDGWFYIGAAVTHHQIINNRLIKQHAECLVEACSLIGGPQVRNVATLGGNVAHGLPAADGTIALLAMGAQAELAGPDGRAWHDLADLFVGPGETSFDRGRQILVRFRMPLPSARSGSAFARVMRPQGVAIAILNMATWIKLDQSQKVEHAHLAIGPSGPVPTRARQAEQFLVGRTIDESAAAKVHQLILQESQFRTSRHRATKEYRQHLSSVLVERTLPAAYDRARTNAGRG